MVVRILVASLLLASIGGGSFASGALSSLPVEAESAAHDGTRHDPVDAWSPIAAPPASGGPLFGRGVPSLRFVRVRAGRPDVRTEGLRAPPA